MSQSKIYVGNLSYDTTDANLEEFFSKYGKLEEVKLIQDSQTGRSKGFSFLTFENKQDAKASLEANGTELQGRKIRVNIAEDKRRGDAGSRRGDQRDRY